MVRTEVRSRHGRLASRPRLRRRAGADRPALLHQLGRAALRRRRRYASSPQGYASSRAARFAKAARVMPREAAARRETAILAGGCFWGMEEILRAMPGVLETEVGYTGGTLANPRYEDVHDRARPGHAESVRIVFDPAQDHLRASCSATSSACTTRRRRNRQGNDIGTQYRSAIFYVERARSARSPRRVKARGRTLGQVAAADRRPRSSPPGPFYRAEDYHQDYLEKHPGGYTCRRTPGSG